MKKIAKYVLTLASLFALAGCNTDPEPISLSSQTSSTPTTSSETSSENPSSSEASSEQTTSEDTSSSEETTSTTESSPSSESEPSSSESSSTTSEEPPAPPKTAGAIIKDFEFGDIENEAVTEIFDSSVNKKSLLKRAVETYSTDRLNGTCTLDGDDYIWTNLGIYQGAVTKAVDEAFSQYGGQAFEYINVFKEYLPADAAFNTRYDVPAHVDMYGSEFDMVLHFYVQGNEDDYTFYFQGDITMMPGFALKASLRSKKESDGSYTYETRLNNPESYSALQRDAIYVNRWNEGKFYEKYTVYDVEASEMVSGNQGRFFRVEKNNDGYWTFYRRYDDGGEDVVAQTATGWYYAIRVRRDSNGNILNQMNELNIATPETYDIVQASLDASKQIVYLNNFEGYSQFKQNKDYVVEDSHYSYYAGGVRYDAGNYYEGTVNMYVQGEDDPVFVSPTSKTTPDVNIISVEGSYSYNVRIKSVDDEKTNRSLYVATLLFVDTYDNLENYLENTLGLTCKYGDIGDFLDGGVAFASNLKGAMANVDLYGLTADITYDEFKDTFVTIASEKNLNPELEVLFA